MRNRYSSKKKLGVLVSSLALVAVTAMAGVTGTAAWFTATRSATATAGTFTAYDPNGALTIKANAGQGTATVDGDSSKITTMVNQKQNYLRDASVDVENQKVYSAYMDDDDKVSDGSSVVHEYKVTGYNLVANGTETALKDNTGLSTGLSYPSAGVVYYAFSWTYTFKLSKTGANGSALFFDLTSAFSGTTTAVSNGFRIGFKTTAGSADNTTPWFVWGKDEATTENKANNYVNGTTTTSIGTYNATSDDPSQRYFITTSDSRYLDQELTLAEAQKSPKKDTRRSVYLGKFTSANTTTGITVTAVAWYEGNDTAVNSNNVAAGQDASKAITAKMTFYTRDLAKANS